MKRSMKVFGFAMVALFLAGVHSVSAQNQKRIIQLSGILLKPDSVNPVVGAHIYVPKAGRGAQSNATGFFSIPVQTGDSIVFTYVGFVRRHMIVPADSPEFSTVIIVMTEDVTKLPDLVVTPYATEEIFKEAILALNIPMDANGVDKSQLNAELMALMIKTTPMDGRQNYSYYMNQYPGSIQNKFMPQTNPFLNVFNWAKFIKQVKQQKRDKDRENN